MVKTIDYEFPRGDSFLLKKFRVTDTSGNVMELKDTDQLYFTVKTDSNSSIALFQKKINDGIELQDDGYYHITIEPKDTNGLDYGNYVYDIQVKRTVPKDYVKTLIDGTITLTNEVTWEVNE
ncbi:MAG TPA: hypothetical protein DCE23_04205 [Firmicutes bacterium]|nr:hypothetical protein [Bacillota bacterium]